MIKSKRLFVSAGLLAFFIFTETSCSKQSTLPEQETVATSIQFSLYTSKDFLGDESNISFTVFVQDLQNQVIWDSALAPMKAKEIPGIANALVIQKSVSSPARQILKAGFKYSIENVGNSWFYDTCNAGASFKEIKFNFQ
jgi:hypothetical protein